MDKEAEDHNFLTGGLDFGQQLESIHNSEKNDPMEDHGFNFVLKSSKLSKKKSGIRYTNVDDLVKSPVTPVKLGMKVICTLNKEEGVIRKDHQGKAFLQYYHQGTLKQGSIPQFFKHATGMTFSKSSHWNTIVFHDDETDEQVSLENIKFIVDGPRKVMSAFMYFSNEMRETYKEKMSSRNIVKACGSMWKSMTEEMKRVYKEKEEADKERFSRQKQEWMLQLQKRESNDNQ